MALKMVTKPQVSPAVQEVVEAVQKVKVETEAQTEIQALTQEYIVLFKKFVERDVKNILKRMDEIKKSLHAVANETMDAKKPAIFKCAEGEVEFTERGTETIVVSPETLITHLQGKFSSEVAYSVVDIRLGELRKVLSPMELQKFVKEAEGSRRLEAVRPVNAA